MVFFLIAVAAHCDASRRLFMANAVKGGVNNLTSHQAPSWQRITSTKIKGGETAAFHISQFLWEYICRLHTYSDGFQHESYDRCLAFCGKRWVDDGNSQHSYEAVLARSASSVSHMIETPFVYRNASCSKSQSLMQQLEMAVKQTETSLQETKQQHSQQQHMLQQLQKYRLEVTQHLANTQQFTVSCTSAQIQIEMESLAVSKTLDGAAGILSNSLQKALRAAAAMKLIRTLKL